MPLHLATSTLVVCTLASSISMAATPERRGWRTCTFTILIPIIGQQLTAPTEMRHPAVLLWLLKFTRYVTLETPMLFLDMDSHVTVPLQNSLYVFGGYNGQTVLNDFYKFRLKPVKVSPPSLVNDLSRLLQTPELADVCFRVEGKSVYANRAILAIRSEYFRVMLCGGMRESQFERRQLPRTPSLNHCQMDTDGTSPTQEGIHVDEERSDSNMGEIDLPDVSYPVFIKVLEYLYTDSIQEISLDLGIQLLIASEQFMLDRLKSLCEDLIRQDIDVNNVLGILVASHRHNATCLKGMALDFVLRHLNDATIMTGLSELRQEPDLLLEIIKRNAGTQPGLPNSGNAARVISSPMVSGSGGRGESGGPFGQGSEWSARR